MDKDTAFEKILSTVEESETLDELSHAIMTISHKYDDACYRPSMPRFFRLAHKKLAELRVKMNLPSKDARNLP